MLDYVLEGGTVYDGRGTAPIAADVGLTGGFVRKIGDLSEASASQRINVAGLAVSPGFIDLHTHSDFTLLVDGRAQSQVHQGVTTEVVGQCGFSCAPVTCDKDIQASGVGYVSGCLHLGWRSFGEYLARLDATPLGVNVAAFVGQGAIHRAVLGDALRPPQPEELESMQRLVEQAFDQGALGMSTGLEYWPGSLSSVEQIVPLCEVAAREGGLYATHVRNRDLYYDLGFAEAISTARSAGARLQISHIQPKFGAPAYAMTHTLEMIEAAQRQGVDIAFDVIPHDWSHTRVSAILPQWAQEGGAPKLLQRLANPELRAALKRNPNPMWRLVSAGRWEEIVLLRSDANPHLVGASFAEIGRDRHRDPYDALLDLLLEEGEGLHNLLWTSRSFSDADIRMCLEQPGCAVISDTLALAPDGALAEQIGSLSGYGWTARFLGVYVRDESVLSLAEAIRKLTSLPAERIGLKDRGVLQPGFKADITVFDPAAITSYCTVREPRRYPDGIAHVFVNGEAVILDGVRCPANPGRVLRHGKG